MTGMRKAREMTRAMGRWVRAAWLAGVLLAALAAPSVALAVPTAPGVRDATVNQGGARVTLWWAASTDVDAGTIQYTVYRDDVPMTLATYLANGEEVLTTTDTTVTVSPKADEVAKKFTYYYMVLATNTTTGLKAVSVNIAPNVHGGLRSGYPTYNCQLCHNVHGAPPEGYLGASSTWGCYRCHGNTDAAKSFGDKAVRNVQKDFYDYTEGQTIPPTVSRHYNAVNVANETQCTMCHSPHKSPYYVNPVTALKEDEKSYTQLLRAEISSGSYSYSTDAAPSGNTFCLQCHGATSGAIEFNGGTGAYAASSGDHTYVAGAVHNEAVVLTNNDSHATNPGIQCEACHNKHASAADKLIAYRGDDSSTTSADGTYAQAELCYACHSAASTDTRMAAGYAAPYAWNGRDVKAQFGKASHHPTTAGSGRWVEKSGTIFSQTSQADFETDTRSQVSTTLVPDSVVLGQYTTTVDPPAQPIMYGQSGGSTTFDEYTPWTNTWNDLFNAANVTASTGVGSSSVYGDGYVFTTRGNAADIWRYNQSTNAWATPTNSPLPGNVNRGSDGAIDEINNNFVYFTAGNGSTALYSWDYDNTNEYTITIRNSSGTNQLQDRGSSIAYSPDADRLWLINRDDITTGGDQGDLFYLPAPGGKSGNQNFTDPGIRVTRNDGTGAYTRMTYGDVGGTDYLFIIGYDDTNTLNLQVVSNLGAATPTRTRIGKYPFTTNALGEGCDLAWDGGGYLYAIRGGNQTGFSRIAIPADPTNAASWGSWESLASPLWWGGTWDQGSSIVRGVYDQAPYSGQAYYASGTITTTDIAHIDGQADWGTLTWTETQPAGTTLSVTVQGWDGDSWESLVTAATSPADLSSYPVSTYTKLRLVGTFTTTDDFATPQLDDWTVSANAPVWNTAGSLTCANCHNVHSVQRGTLGTAWDLLRASLPSNTKQVYAGTATQFCLECHDGSAPTTDANDAATLVPYSIGFRDITAADSPFFPGWNKAAAGADWENSAHNNSLVRQMTPECSSCHDPHASDNARLTALTAVNPNTGAPVTHVQKVRDNSTDFAEENLCYVCHTKDTVPNCAGGSCHGATATYTRTVALINVETAFTDAANKYRHPVERSTGNPSGLEGHSDLESGVSGFGSANRHAECVDCHDPHAAKRGIHTVGSSKSGNALHGATGIKVAAWPANWTAVAADAWTTERMTGEDTDYEAYVCLKCHSSYSGQPFSVTSGSGTYTSTDVAMEFNPSNMSEHNVFGQSIGMESAFSFIDSTGTSRNVTWAVPTASFFLSGSSWTVNSKLTCTDCHTGSSANARGPHGSTVTWLLDPEYPDDWKQTFVDNSYALGMSIDPGTERAADSICTKCHDLSGPNSTGAWSNNVHSKGDHQGSVDGLCINCHISVPHGWSRPRLLGQIGDNPRYRAVEMERYLATASHTLNTDGVVQWNKDDCDTACGGHPTITTYMPDIN